MKNVFPGYYQPTDDEFEHLWDEALFAFDANVLLNLYRYSEGTRDELLKLLTRLQPRLWLPHQAALEYHKNRLTVISGLEDAYEKITDSVTDFEKKLLNALNGFTRHPLIQIGPITDALKKTFFEIRTDLSNIRKGHPELTREDPVRDGVTRIFEGSVGPAYSDEHLRKIYGEGKVRYEKQIPPGFKDDHKEDELKYGDLVVWKQLIDKARASNKPLIFVTDDRKEDWWERVKGRVIRPRPELIQEMWELTGVKFYMYQTDPFMEQAARRLKRKVKVKQNAIDEIKEVRTFYDRLRSQKNGSGLPVVPFDTTKVNKKYLGLLGIAQEDEDRLENSARDNWYDMVTKLYINDKLAREEELQKMLQKGSGGLLSMYEGVEGIMDNPQKEIDD